MNRHAQINFLAFPSVDTSIASTAAPAPPGSVDQQCCMPTPPCEIFTPCSEPSSHPTVTALSSVEMATALIEDLGFLSLGHLSNTIAIRSYGSGRVGCACVFGSFVPYD